MELKINDEIIITRAPYKGVKGRIVKRPMGSNTVLVAVTNVPIWFNPIVANRFLDVLPGSELLISSYACLKISGLLDNKQTIEEMQREKMRKLYGHLRPKRISSEDFDLTYANDDTHENF